MSEFGIHKGIGKPISVKGIKGQYIYYTLAGVIGSFLFFIFLYLIGISLYITTPILFLGLTGTFLIVGYLNKTYGQHGIMKLSAKNKRPQFLVNRGTYIKVLKYKDHDD